ncbi:NAD(P)-dependent alcohol dehydrogenase [Nocardiopsis sp. EMB25]|uniref:NAD(P)-dependent alcohol dehydrogenase n=1 Tax=Nocardiopsis sp. EMB25 TaxID=2835867 RepID=UPI0022834C94|nr:NAD(P)-dependent alcohol dehydrogenase [Nocardiopsis sp. EMB25]MCY9784884.1 NAD(P)-dependent alcohol dehydrogenase [Nocardiopsis sp. EMB25]
MRAVVHRAFGPPDVLNVEEVPTPTPRSDELLIRVHAATVTAVDGAARRGEPLPARLAFGPFRPKYPTLGADCAGRVEAVGEDVRDFAPGDEVVALSPRFGTHAEYVCVPQDAPVVAKSSALTHAETVAVSEGALTALPFLRDAARLRPGRSILVNGASGSIGSAAVQLAAHMGVEVTAVCSGGNADLVRSLGAHRVIDHTAEDFTEAREAYDVVFDAVGKSSFGRCRRALKVGGHYLTTVSSMAIMGQTMWTRLGRKRASIALTGLRPAPDKARDLVLIRGLAEAGTIRAVIDRSYPLDRAVEAHGYVDAGHKKGAVVMRMSGED